MHSIDSENVLQSRSVVTVPSGNNPAHLIIPSDVRSDKYTNMGAVLSRHMRCMAVMAEAGSRVGMATLPMRPCELV